MAQRFKGKIVLVTGSSEGIGYGIAYRIASEGGHVVITSRTEEKVKKAVGEIKKAGFSASGFAGDIGKPSDRKGLIQHTLEFKNRIDVLVNNAVYQSDKATEPLLGATSEEWDKNFYLNVKVGWELVKETVEHIPKGGSILFVSSIVGYAPGPPLSLYSVTKTAVLGLSQALAKELAPKGIRVNTLSPGPIDTPLLSAGEKESPGFKQHFANLTLLKRLGTIEEMGAAAAFLTSDDGGFVVGESLIAGGGAVTQL